MGVAVIRTLTDAERVNALLEEVGRLHERLDGQAATIARYQQRIASAGGNPLEPVDLAIERRQHERTHEVLDAVKDELLVAETANETLRTELAEANSRAKRAEAEVEEWQKTLRICREEASKGAARVRKRHAAELAEVRTELEQVRATLAPLWPGGDVDSATALATATVLALQGHRASEDERQAYAGLEPVTRPSFVDVWTDETLLERRPSLCFTFGQALGVGIGGVVLGVASGAVAVIGLVGRWPW